MTNATELLSRALESLNILEDQLKDLGYVWLNGPQLKEEIETFLATEPARKPMTEEEIDSKFALDGSMFSSYTAFKQGVRFAEKHHGIGGDDNG